MKIGIIGSGHMGGNLGRLWAKAGHHVLFSSRHPEQLRDLVESSGSRARTGSVIEAANYGDAVLLAPNFANLEQALKEAGSLNGRIVIDITNPVRWDEKENRMIRLLGENETAVSVVARKATRARVIKAYSNLHWQYLVENTNRSQEKKLTVFYCGNDSLAKRVVAELIEESGFNPLDIGDLNQARLMEIPGPLSGKALPIEEARKLLEEVRSNRRLAA